MKLGKLFSSFLILALLLALAPAQSISAADVFVEPFDDSSQFTTSTSFFSDAGVSSGYDFFGISDGAGGGDFGGDPQPNGIKAYTGFTGSFLTGMDLDGEGATLPITVEWTSISISGIPSLSFSGDFAEYFDDPGDIDAPDFILVEYQIDGGGYQNLISFRLDENETDTFNGVFREDTDFNGSGDGAILGNAAQTFTKDIVGTGSTLDLRLTVSVDSGDEDFAVDNFTIGESQPSSSDPILNEFVFNHVGSDTNEYVEVFGDPNTDYSAFTIVEIEGDGSSAGLIDDGTMKVGTTNSDGYWTSGFQNNLWENDNVTLLLVEGYIGSVGQDLDTDNDGAFDGTLPWTRIVDDVAVDDSGTVYSTSALDAGFDGGSFTVGGASRIPNGSDTDTIGDWVRNDFDLFGIPGFPGSPALGEAENTPNAVNAEITVLTDPIGVCGDPATLIHEIQEGGSLNPDTGSIREIEGIVTGDFEGSTGLSGFFMQEETADFDGDGTTSEGIFVYNGSADSVNSGDTVRVRGTVAEYFGLTELNNVISVTVCPATGTTAPTSWSLPVSAVSDWEWVEGMKVIINQTLYASGNYTWARYGEVDLSVGAPLDNPTNVVAPGAPAIALQDLNDRSRIQLDDGSTVQNPLPYPPYLGVGNTQRTGDTLPSLTGNVGYAFGVYEMHPTQSVDFTRANERPGVPSVGGTIQVASYNVLNYFTTIDNGSPICGPLSNQDCRGADTEDEFERQKAKIVDAISTLDADVVGLMEIENAPDNTPEANLVAGLNDVKGPGTYNYIAAGAIGGDAIRVALLYQPTSVTPVGGFKVLDSNTDPNFDDTRNRPMLVQSFVENATGAVFTVGVNHLKSKGSACLPDDPDTGDGQGNCNLTRTAAAQAIVDYLAGDPTGVGDSDYLVIGDMNSYAMEDPISTMKAGGYTNLIEMFQGVGFTESAYSYNFESQSGYLDHGLSSETMMPQVTGAAFWHVNADEPAGLDYNNYNQPLLYSPDEFRSSDHDPVIIGIDMTAEQVKELIDAVQGLVDDGTLNSGQGNALISKLENVLAKLADGNTNAAANQLNAFINQVEDFVDEGILTSEQAEPLITSASLLVEFLSK